VKFPLLYLLLFHLAVCHLAAQQGELERIAYSLDSAADWEWVAREISQPASRELIEDALTKREVYPRKELLPLLSHPQLAIRLGALELLEVAADTSYSFNPWLEIDDPANKEPLSLWHEWAETNGPITRTTSTLSTEQMQTYLRDIISGKSERKSRAIRMLNLHSLSAVSAIQQFLTDKSGLPQSSILDLKEAQYLLVLNRHSPRTAAVIARDLTRGNQDQLLSSLSRLKKSGFLAIPIIRDFIDSPDPLVRETAIDAILSLGGPSIVSLIAPALEKEKDLNVIHAAMRGLRQIGGSEAREIARKYLNSENEDMLIAALETLTKFLKSKNRFSSSASKTQIENATKEQNDTVQRLLQDSRWRVRSAALEYFAKAKDKTASELIIQCLEDDDAFVRSRAIETIVQLNLREAQSTLEKLFLKDDELIGPVSSALTGMKVPLPNKLIAHLDTRHPDIIISAIKALDSDKKAFIEITARYADHDNLDISCAALRSLAEDSDKVKVPLVANHLNAALLSGSEEKRRAVLGTLRLPKNSSSRLKKASRSTRDPSKATSLDSLYNAFLKPHGDIKEEITLEPSNKPKASGGVSGLLSTLKSLLGSWESDPEQNFRIAYILGLGNYPTGYDALFQNFSSLTGSQRASIADDFYTIKDQAATPLMLALIQDKLSAVRKDAIHASLRNEKNLDLIQQTLTQLTAEHTRAEAHEYYGYSIEKLASHRKTRTFITDWCSHFLIPSAQPSHTILALALLRSKISQAQEDQVLELTKSENQWVRRAAWYALCQSRPETALADVDRLLKDPSPLVRTALPMAFSQKKFWLHWFDDVNRKTSSSYNSRQDHTPRLTPENEKLLEKIARTDSHPMVRFESWFSLLSNRRPIDLKAFISLIPEQEPIGDKTGKAISHRISDLLETNYKSMGTGMRPLLAYADTKKISQSKLKKVLAHFSADQSSAFSSFESLAISASTTEEAQVIAGTLSPKEIAKLRQQLKVIVFYKPGCKQCEKAEQNLSDLKDAYPLLEVQRVNILEQDGLLLNRALCDRLQINGAGKTPSFFTQSGAAITPNVKPDALAELLQETMETIDDLEWADFDESALITAQEGVEKTFSNITLAIVILGGLFDGVNPCAFATIIFFLSYLQVAKRSPKEILMVGCSFILAIFLAYFSVGLIFHAAIDKLVELEGFQWARKLMTWVFAFFALLVAVLSLRDGIRASRGNIGDMTLQLPEFLKKRIKGTIRKRARASNYVVAAFITGIIISILELACTGQVYAPIVYQIQQGRTDAVLYLFIYNVAFILPLVVIFILAYKGMTSAALVKFQTTHTSAVKYATAALFFILTIVILFGEKLLTHS